MTALSCTLLACSAPPRVRIEMSDMARLDEVGACLAECRELWHADGDRSVCMSRCPNVAVDDGYCAFASHAVGTYCRQSEVLAAVEGLHPHFTPGAESATAVAHNAKSSW